MTKQHLENIIDCAEGGSGVGPALAIHMAKEILRLRAGLEFYGDLYQYCSCGCDVVCINDDRGKKARDLLEITK